MSRPGFLTRVRRWLAERLFTVAGQLDAIYDVWLDKAEPRHPIAECTWGYCATWCPVHGPCTCPLDDDHEGIAYGADRDCALHGYDSPHGTEESAAKGVTKK
jgi:hypothetical protein